MATRERAPGSPAKTAAKSMIGICAAAAACSRTACSLNRFILCSGSADRTIDPGGGAVPANEDEPAHKTGLANQNVANKARIGEASGMARQAVGPALATMKRF